MSPSGNSSNAPRSWYAISPGKRSGQRRRSVRNDNIRKYILPNIPYLFILWACLKVGTAYRLAAGGNMGQILTL